MAKHWIVISPEGKEFKFDGGLRRFLTEHNIPSWAHRRGFWKGWKWYGISIDKKAV
jgi:hypothetical protein